VRIIHPSGWDFFSLLALIFIVVVVGLFVLVEGCLFFPGVVLSVVVGGVRTAWFDSLGGVILVCGVCCSFNGGLGELFFVSRGLVFFGGFIRSG